MDRADATAHAARHTLHTRTYTQPDKKPLGKIPLAQAWLEVSRALDEKQKKVHCILIATPAGKTYASRTFFN
jgi:hypothetical protein